MLETAMHAICEEVQRVQCTENVVSTSSAGAKRGPEIYPCRHDLHRDARGSRV
jgi:hypothetical protein